MPESSDDIDKISNDNDFYNKNKAPEDVIIDHHRRLDAEGGILYPIQASVADAIRMNEAQWIKTSGTITSVSTVYKMVLAVKRKCRNCFKTDKEIYEKPEFDIISWGNDKGFGDKCLTCGTTSFEIHPEFISAVTVELQDLDAFSEIERLPVILFEDDTRQIHVGERVTITGKVHIIGGSRKKGTKISSLYANSLAYEGKKDVTISNQDKKAIQRFVQKNGSKTIEKLVLMAAPTIIGNNYIKEGLLLVAVATSRGIGHNSQRIHCLLIGPPGLAKSKLAKISTTFVPDSCFESGQSSSGKSLTAIVSKEEENFILRLGPAALARGAICAIDELGRMPYEEQAHLLNIMEEGEFTINKHGIHAKIKAPVTIVATANPSSTNWNNEDKVNINEIPVLKALIDRFDLPFVFRTPRDSQALRELAYGISEIEESAKVPEYLAYIRKHIAYSKTLNPRVTDAAKVMLNEYYIKVAKDFGSPRLLKTLYKLTKARAALKLKNLADEEDARETMQLYNAILQQYQQVVSIVENPSDVAVRLCIETIRLLKWDISFEELLKSVCKENEQVSRYIGDAFALSRNWKARNILERLRNNSNIQQVNEKPVILRWFEDQKEGIKDHRLTHKKGDEGNSPGGNKCASPVTNNPSGTATTTTICDACEEYDNNNVRVEDIRCSGREAGIDKEGENETPGRSMPTAALNNHKSIQNTHSKLGSDSHPSYLSLQQPSASAITYSIIDASASIGGDKENIEKRYNRALEALRIVNDIDYFWNVFDQHASSESGIVQHTKLKTALISSGKFDAGEAQYAIETMVKLGLLIEVDFQKYKKNRD
jgi:DNA replicative helicase MCM subunit Mcm2 (Cdc46/Mcm family)